MVVDFGKSRGLCASDVNFEDAQVLVLSILDDGIVVMRFLVSIVLLSDRSILR